MNFHLSDFAKYLTSWRIDIWLFGLFIFIFIIFSILVFFSFSSYKKFQIENITFKTIENVYGLFHKFSADYNNWKLSHLYCMTDDKYSEICHSIQKSFCSIKVECDFESLLIEYNLREENLIINFLLFYEQVYFQYKHSKNLKLRKEFLQIIDRYFTERLLTNPRIVFFVIQSKNGHELHLEEESFMVLLDRYQVLLNNNHFSISIDSKGPFRFSNTEDIGKYGNLEKMDLAKFNEFRNRN